MKNIFTEEERLYRFTQLEDINFARTLTDCEMDEFRFLFRYFNDPKFREIEDNKEVRMSIETIEFKGKKILYLDHEKKGDKDLVDDLKAGDQAIKKAYQDGEVLLLANFSSSYMSEAAMNYIKSEESKRINLLVKKTAVIGIQGVKKILLKVYNAFMQKEVKVFEDFESAKEYLVS